MRFLAGDGEVPVSTGRGPLKPPGRDLVDADQLAVAVQDVRARVDPLLPGLPFVREDRGDAGSDGIGSAVGPADQRPMADADPGHIGDGVEGTGFTGADPDAEVTGTACWRGSIAADATCQVGGRQGASGG